MSLQDRMAHYRVPGVVVTVVDSDRVAWTRTYGVVEAGTTQAVTTETELIFEFGDEKSAAGELQFGPVTFERIDP